MTASTKAAGGGKARAAWEAFSRRQQLYLAAIYDAGQEARSLVPQRIAEVATDTT